VTENQGDSAVKGVQTLSKTRRLLTIRKVSPEEARPSGPLMKMLVDENGKDIGEELTCKDE